MSSRLCHRRSFKLSWVVQLAIVGGMLAAWRQTSRADKIARQVRLAERNEMPCSAFMPSLPT
jgi:hypothetical protein